MTTTKDLVKPVDIAYIEIPVYQLIAAVELFVDVFGWRQITSYVTYKTDSCEFVTPEYNSPVIFKLTEIHNTETHLGVYNDVRPALMATDPKRVAETIKEWATERGINCSFEITDFEVVLAPTTLTPVLLYLVPRPNIVRIVTFKRTGEGGTKIFMALQLVSSKEYLAWSGHFDSPILRDDNTRYFDSTSSITEFCEKNGYDIVDDDEEEGS